MDATIDEEDKEVTLLCSLPKWWYHLVTTISFITTNALDYDFFVGALLYEEVQRKLIIKTFTPEAMVARDQSWSIHRKMREFKRYIQVKVKRKEEFKNECWYCNKLRNLKTYHWKR